MQRLINMLLAVLAALSITTAGCSSTRNPSAPDGGTGDGTRPGAGSNPSPGTGSGGGGNQPTPAPSGRNTLSWNGTTLRFSTVNSQFTVWKDGGGEVAISLDAWSGAYVPFNATGADKRGAGITMSRSGNDLVLTKDGAAPWLGIAFNVVSGDKFQVKWLGPAGAIGWTKYETTDLSGVQLEADQGSATSKHFLIPTTGII